MEQTTFNRMVTEFEELNKKTNKLRDFLLTKADKVSMDNLNRDLLISQLKAMEAYQGILSIRIGLNNQEGWLDKSAPEISNNQIMKLLLKIFLTLKILKLLKILMK